MATKFGRRAPLDPAAYTYENLRGWLERSRENLGVEAVDLVQLHCPPWETYYTPSVFEACAALVDEGLVRAYGVSVEKVEEGLKALEYPGVATVQIIFNIFRQRPAELFFRQALERDVGVIARVPLASGLLTGKFDRQYALRRRRPPRLQPARRVVRRRRDLLGRRFRDRPRGRRGAPSARAGRARRSRNSRCAGSSTSRPCRRVIPGAKTPDQARANAAAAALPPLSEEIHARSPTSTGGASRRRSPAVVAAPQHGPPSGLRKLSKPVIYEGDAGD